MNNNKLPIILALLAIVWVGMVIVMVYGSHLVIHRFGPLPRQPIEFSHTTHINKLNLTCLYCHKYAEKSIHATIPGADICYNCHKDANIDKPEVKKMLAMIKQQGEIKWQRVYQVKDHVYFTHRVHTVIAKLACQECHGSVENMTVAVLSSGGSSDRGFIEMGWCVTCHKRRGAPRECSTCHK